MHPSTQSFYSFSSNSCLPLHPAELFCTLFRATPLPIPNPRKRTEKGASSIGWEAYSNFALDKCIETSLCQKKKKKELLCVVSKAGARVNEHARQKKVDLALGARTFWWSPPGEGWVLSRLLPYALRTGRGLIPPAAKLGKLELEPLYLGQRPGLHCSTISRAVAGTISCRTKIHYFPRLPRTRPRFGASGGAHPE
jgi:hypothetical protein